MTIDLSNEPDVGFLFHPSEQQNHPGHPRFDVIIPAKPTYRHFDPQMAEFWIATSTKKIQHVHIHHLWARESQGMKSPLRVIPSRIFMTDRQHKRLEAFSFGGSLTIADDDTRTVCALESPVPIFPLLPRHDLAIWFVDEVEMLLARRRAQWDPHHPHSFDVHLASVEPFPLYVSFLRAIKEKLEGRHHSHDKIARQGVQFVAKEIERLQKSPDFPQRISPLSDLL